MQIGDISFHLLNDGLIKMDAGCLFGPTPKAVWGKEVSADKDNRINIAVNCLLIRTKEKNILVDVGLGSKPGNAHASLHPTNGGKLLKELRAMGLKATDIHTVVLTHLHKDHAGGCTRHDHKGNPVQVFTSAQYIVQRKCWQAAQSPSELSQNMYCAEDYAPLIEKDHLNLIDGDEEILPGIRLKLTQGHSPGHQMLLVRAGNRTVAFPGDILPTHHHIPLTTISALDCNPEATLQAKKELLPRAEREGWLLVLSHGLRLKAGYLEGRGESLHMVPVEL